MRWHKVEDRMNELRDKQRELLGEYNGIAELIAEDIEEEDLDSLKKHVADLEGPLRDLRQVREELGTLCDMIDNECEDIRYGEI